jgi:hypothetical protein
VGRSPGPEIEGDPHLRSAKEVVGYRIRAEDVLLGPVEHLLVELPEWSIAGLVIDTRRWLPGKRVVLAPGAVDEIVWNDRSVRVAMTRDEIVASPEFDSDAPVNREWRVLLTDVGGRPVLGPGGPP